MMPYEATDIARRIVELSMERKVRMTHEKLQGLMYMSWKDCFKGTGEHLFEDDIEAWIKGPVVPSVYTEFRYWADGDIMHTKAPSVEIDADTERVLVGVLVRYGDFSGMKLGRICRNESPWRCSYRNKDGTIPFEVMEKAAVEGTDE